jgi:acylphosphatase
VEAVEFVITGRVQGVGFRYFTLRAAVKLGLYGWVRNEADGSVRCRAAGEAEQIAALREKLRRGPPFGRTDHIGETMLSAAEAAQLSRFRIDA